MKKKCELCDILVGPGRYMKKGYLVRERTLWRRVNYGQASGKYKRAIINKEKEDVFLCEECFLDIDNIQRKTKRDCKPTDRSINFKKVKVKMFKDQK